MKSGKQLGSIALGCIVVLVGILLSLRQRSDAFSPSPPILDAKAEDLRATHVSAVLGAPIQPGTNLLWCATFQLAWNEATEFFGEGLSFVEDVPLAATLNRKEFNKGDLDEASYVTFGGVFSPGVPDRIQREVSRKFGPDFNPQLASPPTANTVAFFYACLSKNLAFEKEFQRIEHPLVFGTNEVAAFGIEPGYPGSWRLRQQVRFLDYQNTNDFIIELKTSSKTDTLLLAKMPPQQTLAETVKEVTRRASGHASPDVGFNSLLIPKTDFQLTRTYGELLDKHLALKRTTDWNGYWIAVAEQNVRFRLDEKGAALKSEASVAVASEATLAEPVDLVFDKPFLVLLQRVGADSPYFALWIDNAELLVPWNSGTNSNSAP